MELKEALEKRRSIRKFEQNQISDLDLRTVLDAATKAASAMNEQAWFFVAIQKKEIIEEIAHLATNSDRDPFYGAPTLIVAFGKEDAIAPVVDTTLAMANMMYAACDLELGTCWIHCTKDVFNNPQYAELKTACGVPQGYSCIGSLVVGYPKEMGECKPRKQDVFSIVK